MIVSTALRLRSRVADTAVRDRLKGKVLGPADFDVLLTGATRVTLPDGRLLCVYLPRALASAVSAPGVYPVLHSLRAWRTNNRSDASGSRRVKAAHTTGSGYALAVPSAIIGAMDPNTHWRFCRLTAWTGKHLPEQAHLIPLLQEISEHLAEQAPDRFEAQRDRASVSDPAWVIPGTPFSTVTVNNTYPTGTHKDTGDLNEGLSTLACLRRGQYTGGQLVFPAYRVAVDLQDGDLLLMDAHEWHGNTAIVCSCGDQLNGPCASCGAERISLVSYFRTKIADCGTPDEESQRASAARGGASPSSNSANVRA